MKNLVRNILVLAAMLVMSCGPSIKVTDTWQAPDIKNAKSDKFLVMARVDDMVGRQRFENEIVAKLKNEGIQATESYKQYPSVNLNQKVTESDVEQFVTQLKKDGYQGVVLTVIKDVKKEVKTSQSGGYVSGGYYPAGYDYYGDFDYYYGSYYSPYGVGGTYVPSSQRTYESETYKLETVVYELSRPSSQQLVAVVSVDITDPKSASSIAPGYASKVVGSFDQ